MQSSVATREEVEAFAKDRQWSEALRGVLAEIATTGVLRYPWTLLAPLFCTQLKTVLQSYPDDATEGIFEELSQAMNALTAAPFTAQRLAEVLLEPKKQYTRVAKVTSALEKLVSVSTTLPVTLDPPPLPLLASLPVVNANPPPVQLRHVASSETFRGFLEERTRLATNGSTLTEPPNLLRHVCVKKEETQTLK